jgi:putative NADH-flavin reductase
MTDPLPRSAGAVDAGMLHPPETPEDPSSPHSVASAVAETPAAAPPAVAEQQGPPEDGVATPPDARPLVVAVFGATGPVGHELARQALRSGDTVRALVRNVSQLAIRHERLQVVEGDLRDDAAVGKAIAGSDAVIDALVPTPGSERDLDGLADAVRSILGAMERHGVRRLVVLSGAAVSLPGERKPFADAVAARIQRLTSGALVEAKQRELDAFIDSPLDWVAVRPSRLGEGPLTGRYRAGRRPLGPRARISRSDLADFLLRQARDDSFVRQAPYVGA